MFVAGLPRLCESLFTTSNMAIAIPNGSQIFLARHAGVGTIGDGTPLPFVLAFFFTFIIGGLSGVMVASVPIDTQVHDTYFVVAHFRYVLIGDAVFPLMGAIYYWFPKLTGQR
jgi:heme/copper-type cytochrome/quinol oxidase subunit 1